MSEKNPFREAEAKIAGILKALEIETNEVIEGIDLDSIEVTRMGDEVRRFHRQVRIFSHRIPGNDW